MVKNPDIVASVGKMVEHRPFVVGFAAETQNVEEYARKKREQKQLDLICANDVSIENQGFNSDNNALHLIWANGEARLPHSSKAQLSHRLLDEIAKHYDEKKLMLKSLMHVLVKNIHFLLMPRQALLV